MNNAQKQFVDILSAGIRGKSADKVYDNVEWDEVILEKPLAILELFAPLLPSL